MSLFWRTDADHHPDPIDEERFCGMEPPTLLEQHHDHLDHQDRIRDFSPERVGHVAWRPPALTPLTPATPSRLPSLLMARTAGASNHPGKDPHD